MIEIDWELSAAITNAMRAERRRRKGGFSPVALFAASDLGAWYDPSDLTTLFQDSTGTTPVTAAGQPVGLMLDKSRGPTLGAESATNRGFDSDTAWAKESGWTISGGVATKTAGVAGSLYQAAGSMVQGRTYEITFTVSGYSAGTMTPFCRGSVGVGVTANGTYTQRLAAGADSVYAINFYADATFAGSIDNVSVREIPGTHATQSTAAARPTYRITSGVPNLEDDLVDDAISWTAQAGNYTVAWVDTAGSVTILTAQALTGATDALRAQYQVGYLAINRALTAQETTYLTAWFRRKAGV